MSRRCRAPALSVMLGSIAAVATPMLAFAACNSRLGDEDVGALPDQLGRETERKVHGELQVRKRQRRLFPIRRRHPAQYGEKVGGLIDLLLEGRQRRLRAGDLTLQAQDVGVRNRPRGRLRLRDSHLLA